MTTGYTVTCKLCGKYIDTDSMDYHLRKRHEIKIKNIMYGRSREYKKYFKDFPKY